MKKYIFLGILSLSLAGFFFQVKLGMGALALLLAWVAYENFLRTRFRFLRGSGFKERHFDLSSDPAQVEISLSGKAAIFAGVDQSLSLWGLQGQKWERPMEAGTLALLPLDDGACIYALADELVLLDAAGVAKRRLSFSPAQYKQSYSLALSGDGMTLMLHTPWFLQFAAVDLSAWTGSISCEETGHYMKYACLAGDGSRVYFAGAKLLEEEQATQARWGCWELQQSTWVPLWSQAEESYGNSHLRGLSLSRDSSCLVVEIYKEGYEFRVLQADGSLQWKRAGEHPVLGLDGKFLLWENPFEGLTLTDLESQKKIWSFKHEEQIRLKSLDNAGACWVVEGRRFYRLDTAGFKTWTAWFQQDPNRLIGSAAGRIVALVGPRKGALLRLPQ